MKKHELTLEKVTAKVPTEGRVYRASDFLTKDEIDKLHAVNARGKQITRKFDDIDAFCAELLARFGWEAYQAWIRGDFSHEKAQRFILAERAREIGKTIPMQATLVNAVAGANNPDRHKHAPATLKQAIKQIKQQQKQAKGIM